VHADDAMRRWTACATARSKARPRCWPGGPTDPDVCLLRIEPFTAALWDGPASAVVTAFEFAKARLTGEEPKVGENRKVTVKM
jgi:hypothetical protein